MVILIWWFFLKINTCSLNLPTLVLRLWYYCFCLRIWNVIIWEVYNLKYFTICNIKFYSFKGWIKYAIKWTKRNINLGFRWNKRYYFRYIFILIAISNNWFLIMWNKFSRNFFNDYKSNKQILFDWYLIFCCFKWEFNEYKFSTKFVIFWVKNASNFI